MVKVLFVCMGNICRSPMAEGIFLQLLEEKGLASKYGCESAGIISYHAGELADPRMRQVAASKGIHLVTRSRQIRPSDFVDFDYIVAMDENNLRGIEEVRARVAKQGGELAKVLKMRMFDAQESGLDVEDPYYQADTGFENCYQVLHESCTNFLAYLQSDPTQLKG